ncbi:unnamed protein product [Adineta ricciae]|uniref:Uncharacterized protein n=1 Tax=Adineta ricciae TaxID=249248 RepID=A0A813T952_ADIRI|nr:unnamed protein product [Adineta ricciae]CAF0911133.1 unnamed protein product [Adineta ricciae]
MRRVHSFEFNNSSVFFQQPKKVSIPATNESTYRSEPQTTDRSTIVPVTLVPNDIPNYFGSAMQSMCLAFFTFAYTELIDGAVFAGNVILLHVFLKFLIILSISLTLFAAFASIRVSIFTCQTSENNPAIIGSNKAKFYSSIAHYGSIISTTTCAIIICIIAILSLYVTFHERTV